ncbi:hypothetical protein [Subtercola vilae]|uniref:TPM domain-containing protein n=1 Tax=Subtercola vilae TaxID=2056433 RepID=A0A4T2BD42_9MICO|nr:hypothetical protein [Subtercola vilae]TIH28600.1 hypothetical protein D4765_18395 [Subtercola vilae]
MNFKRAIGVSFAGIALAALGPGLAGCSSALTETAGTAIPSVAAGTAAATPTPIPGDTDGDGKLSEFEKEQLASKAIRTYTMSDGSKVHFDPTQPLPDSVASDISDRAQEAMSAVNHAGLDGDAQDAAMKGMFAFVDTQAEAIGRPIVLVVFDNGSWGTLTSIGLTHSTGITGGSKENTLLLAQTWASNHGAALVILG